MFWQTVPLAIVSLALVIGLSNQHPLDRPEEHSQVSSDTSLTLVPSSTNDVQNETKDTPVTDGIFLRKILLGAFLPGGLGEAISQRKEPRRHTDLLDTAQEIKEELVVIRKILQEQQDKENYRDHVVVVNRERDSRERKDDANIDVFDFFEFVILVCVLYILFKVIFWMCKRTTSEEISRATTKADEDSLIVGGADEETVFCAQYTTQETEDKQRSGAAV